WEIRNVPYPIRLDCPYDHYVIVNSKDWDTFDTKHKAMLVFDVLCSIDREEPGKTVPFDLKDHAVVIRTIGTDYKKRADIPDILEATV
ncbi:hypothetical protein QVN24_17220, partial [Yersinia ruckeri]|uniref:putative metallopeptidase n=1 Tax=Yersinia ruckeri TaxID=29486 RepID=UPI0025AA5224